MILLTQFGWLMFAFLCGPEEAAWSWPFRNMSYDQFSKNDKERQMKVAHRFGWFAVMAIGITLSVNTTYAVLQTFDLLFVFLFAVILALEYWVLFDGSFGIAIKRGFFYIGEEADTDKAIGSKGKLKAIACLIVIAGLNILLHFKSW